MEDDRLVDAAGATSGIVLTHTIDPLDIALDALDASIDLAGFTWQRDLRLPTGEPIRISATEDRRFLRGPDGWLENLAMGDTIAVRVADGVVHIERLDAAPTIDERLVRVVRDTFHAEVDADLPVEGRDLIVAVRAADPTAFVTPTAPLSALAMAAGLDHRGGAIADEARRWSNAERARRARAVIETFGGDDPRAVAVIRCLDVADVLGLEEDEDGREAPDDATLLEVVGHLRDDAVLGLVVVDLLEPDRYHDDPEWRATCFASALRRVARQPADVATARFIQARVLEHAGETLAAESVLQRGLDADPDHPLILDRLAFYAFVRGEAARAASLWHRTPPMPVFTDDLAEAERRAGLQAEPGRNQPCPCGSGRKYKHCHFGATTDEALANRVGWLYRKAVGYLSRHCRKADKDLFALAKAFAEPGADAEARAALIDHPLVVDLALVEHDWFDRFHGDLFDLLPEDERRIAATWLRIPRTIYEVHRVQDADLVLRDLRRDAEVTVRNLSGFAVGQHLLARAVPDGDDHQFIGPVVLVPAARVDDVPALLDRGDPRHLARWVRDLHVPTVATP